MAFAFGAQAQSVNGYGADDSSFITQWTVTAATTVTIPITGSGFNISWWQGTGVATAGVNTVVANGSTTSITFPAAGTYTVAIPPGTGAATPFSAISMSNNSSAQYLTQVTQWGTAAWSSCLFGGCSNLTITATDIPNFTGVTNISYMFNGCISLAAVPNINNWDVSNVTNMSGMFSSASVFNGNISNWNTSKVTNMSSMFSSAAAFNQPLNSWDVSHVTTMSGMFTGAAAFNKPLDSWNTSKVTDMSFMFQTASVFNQNIDDWNVSSVTNMNNMFTQTAAFNQPLDSWNTSKVTTMENMFNSATAFNQNIDDWNVSSVTNMGYMFNGATVFNKPLNSWNISNVTFIGYMFAQATAFNQPLNNWNTSKVTFMASMFLDATAFNQNLGSWNLSSVNTLPGQSLSDLLSYTGVSCANYDSTLQGWAGSSTTPNGLTLGVSGLTYDKATAQAAHDSLTNLKSWTITGDAGGSCVLPITLSSFSAVKQGNTALLQWTTATEINNKGFGIQRSPDANSWNDISFVNSKAVNGNSSSSLNYSYTDNAPASGINYYRLKQVDLNGNADYSQVKSLDFGVKATIYPNPVSSQLNVSVAGNSSYQLINAVGNVVMTGSFSTGNNVLNVGGIAAGTYLLRISSNGSVVVYKVIKK